MITVDTHTDAWVADSRAGFYLILLCLDVDASLLQGVSTLHAVVTMLSVWHECVRDVCPTIAVDTMHIRFGVIILLFAAAVAVFVMVTVAVIVTHD